MTNMHGKNRLIFINKTNDYKYLIILCLLVINTINPSVISAQKLDSIPPQKQKSSKWNDLKKVISHTTHWLFVGDSWKIMDSIPTIHQKRYLTFGGGRGLDDYLSPSTHEGWQIGYDMLGYKRSSLKYASSNQWNINFDAGIYRNPLNSSPLYWLGFDSSWGIGFDVISRKLLKWDIAPMFNLNSQLVAKTTNVNNVFNLKISPGLDIASNLIGSFSIKDWKFFLFYRAQISLLHFTFAPGYGQPYYDYISGDNGAKLKFQFAHPFKNRLYLRQKLGLDIPFRSHTLSVAFTYNYLKEELNFRRYNHEKWGFSIGFSTDVFSISGSKSVLSPHIDSSFH